MKDIQVRINLKDKETGKLMSTYPPIAAKNNGLNSWPVDDNWEILSVERNSGVEIPDILGREWVAYEGDKITLMAYAPRDYVISFQDGMFGILIAGDLEEMSENFVNTLESAMFTSSNIREYHHQQFTLNCAMNKDKDFFIPLAHLNIGGTINGMGVIIITKQKD